MTTLCLSIFEHDDPHVRINHQYYCSQLGYQHEIASIAGLQCIGYRILYKYEKILHHLRHIPEQSLLVCATEDCVFFGMHAIENMAEGHEYLLIGIDGEGYNRQTAIQVWRNTARVRALILDFIARANITTGLTDELELHASLDYLPAYTTLAGNYCAVMSNARRQPTWAKHQNIWTLVLSDIALYGRTPARFRSALCEHVNDHQQKGKPLLEFPAYANVVRDDFSIYNPGQPTAIIMYYTPNIRQFGEISESNILRYSNYHGYTLYVHRATPAEAESGISGAWLKPWFLRKYLPHHEWVLWIDSDILFIDQTKKLEPLLAGRDIVAAHDVGNWLINSGVLGLRNTRRNLELIDLMLESIRAVPDKSSTYASGGDQTVIANILKHQLNWSLETALDFISLNTPWFFQQDSSLMAHYYGLATEIRALIMSAHDRSSQELFSQSMATHTR